MAFIDSLPLTVTQHPKLLASHSRKFLKSVKGREAFRVAIDNGPVYGFGRKAYACMCSLQHLFVTGRLATAYDAYCRNLTAYDLLVLVCKLVENASEGAGEGDFEDAWMAYLKKTVKSGVALSYC